MEFLTPFQCGYSIFGKYRESKDYQLDILLRELSRAVHMYIFHHLILVGDAVPKKVARWISQGSKFRFGSLCIFFLE